MNARLARRIVAAVCFVVLAGCAGLGGNTAKQSIAEEQTTAATPAAVSFAQADLNGDARISRREFELWRRQSAAAANAQAAAGGTGEHDAFSAADTDLNDVLTLDEWQGMTGSPSAPALGTPPRQPGATPQQPNAASRP